MCSIDSLGTSVMRESGPQWCENSFLVNFTSFSRIRGTTWLVFQWRCESWFWVTVYMDVSKNRGTPKSSILLGFSIINHPLWGTTIFGNTHMNTYDVWSTSLDSKGAFDTSLNSSISQIHRTWWWSESWICSGCWFKQIQLENRGENLMQNLVADSKPLWL